MKKYGKIALVSVALGVVHLGFSAVAANLELGSSSFTFSPDEGGSTCNQQDVDTGGGDV